MINISVPEERRTSPVGIRIRPMLPPFLRALLHLTTSRLDLDQDVHPALVLRVQSMQEDGWWIRSALPRNYLLWLNGKTMHDPRRPVLVLPQARRSVPPLSWNVFLAVELVRAKERLHRGARPDLSALALRELTGLIEHIDACSSVRVIDPLRLHREAAATFAFAPPP